MLQPLQDQPTAIELDAEPCHREKLPPTRTKS